jgi:hypothetical protein
MKNISVPFRGSVPQNLGKTSDRHPDFAGILNIWQEVYDGAAWLNENPQKGRPYVALRLTNKSDSQEQKIKLAIWERHERTSDADPHFEATADIFEQKFKVCAWIMQDPDDGAYRLDLTLEPVTLDTDSLPEAAAKAQERLESFVRSQRLVPAVPDKPESTSTKSPPTAAAPDDEPVDIPF